MTRPKTQLEHWIAQLADTWGYDSGALPDTSILDAREPGPDQLQLAALIQHLRRDMNDDFFGMARHAVAHGSADVVVRSSQTAATLDEFLLTLIPASELIYCATDIHGRLSSEGGLCRLIIQDASREEMQRIFPIYALMAMHRGLCWLTNRFIRLQRVELTGTAKSLQDDVETVFGCKAELGADNNSLVFAEHFLTSPLRRSPAEIHAYLQRRPLDILFIPGEESSVSASVESAFRQYLEAHQQLPSSSHIAEQLQMAESRLLRDLSLECGGWQNLKNRVRRERAEYLLSSTRHSMEKIAEELGFAEANSFFRAFRRWTGHSPKQFRESSQPD